MSRSVRLEKTPLECFPYRRRDEPELAEARAKIAAFSLQA